jgi:hypothetical protein
MRDLSNRGMLKLRYLHRDWDAEVENTIGGKVLDGCLND